MTACTSSDLVAFLAACGETDVSLAPLPGDASARRYYRLEGRGKMLMEDRLDPVGFAGFIRIARHLADLGLSAPQVHCADAESGLALIEDFGTRTYSVQLAAGRAEAELYALAVDALLHLHHHPQAAAVDVPDYDLATLLDELSIFTQWFAPALRPDVDVVAFDAAFRALWQVPLASLDKGPRTLVLRDFHVDNLMELDRREGVRRCGLLDFQDGVIGLPEYDLVSLLQDARRDLAPGLEQAMLERYIAAAPATAGGPAEIRRRYYLLGAQRHTRIAGVFLRLNLRDGKPGYLRFLPRVLRQVETALEVAGLTDVAEFLDRELPGWRQAAPMLAGTA
jgi:aminoglycoside/choline kinase family phosphotransferase